MPATPGHRQKSGVLQVVTRFDLAWMHSQPYKVHVMNAHRVARTLPYHFSSIAFVKACFGRCDLLNCYRHFLRGPFAPVRRPALPSNGAQLQSVVVRFGTMPGNSQTSLRPTGVACLSC